eukprot:124711_1
MIWHKSTAITTENARNSITTRKVLPAAGRSPNTVAFAPSSVNWRRAHARAHSCWSGFGWNSGISRVRSSISQHLTWYNVQRVHQIRLKSCREDRDTARHRIQEENRRKIENENTQLRRNARNAARRALTDTRASELQTQLVEQRADFKVRERARAEIDAYIELERERVRFEETIKHDARQKKNKKNLSIFLAREREIQIAAEREHADNARQAERTRLSHAPANARRVRFRRKIGAVRREERERVEQEKREKEIIAEQRLEALRSKVRVQAEADGARMIGDTVASKSAKSAKKDSDDLFPLHGFSDAQIMKDKRTRVIRALRQAGLHDSAYGRKVIRGMATNSGSLQSSLKIQ